MSGTIDNTDAPFDVNNSVFELFFGKDGTNKLNYPEFTQFLKVSSEKQKQRSNTIGKNKNKNPNSHQTNNQPQK